MTLLCYQRPMQLLRATSCAAALLAAASLLSCRPAQEDGNAINAAANAATERPPLPVADPPMDREALLIAAMRAASTRAAGGDDSEAQRTLEGRRFEFRLRFGCAAQAEEGTTFSVRFDGARRTLRLRAAPNLTAAEPLAASLVPDVDEPVEGFWLPRPWLLTAACPARTEETVETGSGAAASERPARPEAATATATDRPAEPAAGRRTEAPAAQPPGRFMRIGIAQFFREGDPRTFQRRQRPYEVTRTLAEGEQPSAEGYNLVLSGRLRRLPSGRVIACRSEDPDAPPDCIVSVAFDRVWVEVPGSREILAEWSRS